MVVTLAKTKKREAHNLSRDQPDAVPVFVIHKHAIDSKFHYDLRLEFEGMLKSWTVPKGPSMDPRVKRLATEGKNIPLSFARIEESIVGEKMIVWDTGLLEVSGGEEALKRGLLKGRMTFVLRGKKLHGAFSLVRFIGKKQWLLFKRQDKYATSEDVTRNARSVISSRKISDPEPTLKKTS
jgi:bifunctional non-homologous end joining protein LigD